MSSLRFLDVAGAVGLVHAAEEFPDAHRLILTGVRPRVQRVLDRCGAPFATQLVVRTRDDQPPVEQPPAVRPPAAQAPAAQAPAAQAPADRPPVERPSPEQAPA
jgi:hypothetical protein